MKELRVGHDIKDQRDSAQEDTRNRVVEIDHVGLRKGYYLKVDK